MTSGAKKDDQDTVTDYKNDEQRERRMVPDGYNCKQTKEIAEKIS